MRSGLFAMFYGGPDQLMPLPTVLSTLCVFVIIFWNKVRFTFLRMWNALRPGDSARGQNALTGSSEKPNQAARQ
jgi:hypothetical protein